MFNKTGETEMTAALETTVAVLQTADMIMIELGASCPCSEAHVRAWLNEQNTFGDDFFDDAVDMLVELGKIDVDEDGIMDLPHLMSTHEIDSQLAYVFKLFE